MANPFDQFDSANPFDQFDEKAAAPSKDGPTWFERQKGGLASGPINMALGAKQMFGGLDRVDQNILAQNREAEKAAPVAAFLSNVAPAVLLSMVPGANTFAGAGALGAAQALFQPVEGEQTLGNIAKGKALNTAIGGGLGVAGQYGANKIGGLATSIRDKAVQTAALKAPKDAVLAEGRAAGYVVPKSDVSPSFWDNRLESLGGKAAIKQEATIRNQEATNALARKALNLADDQPITTGALDRIREGAGRVYGEVGNLSRQAAKDLEDLKVARSDAKGWFEAYNRSARPTDLARAKKYEQKADDLENWIDWHAVSRGRQDLLPTLKQARKEIAQTYTVERALNKATGDVDARVLGRLFDKQKPLSDGLDTIGKFQQAFPKFTSPAAGTPAPGVSHSEALAGMVAGGMGSMVTGSPAGMAASGLPLVRIPARALALSQFMQKPPQYGPGAITGGLLKYAPPALPVLTRAMAPNMGLLSAE